MTDTIQDLIIVYLLGITGIYKSIPAGFLLDLSGSLIVACTVAGAFTGVFLIYFFGKRIKRFVISRLEKKQRLQRKSEKLDRIIEKYGPAGAGLFGTLIFGPNLTMALGLVLVRSDKKMLAWTLAGTVIWSVVLTVIASFSIELFNLINPF